MYPKKHYFLIGLDMAVYRLFQRIFSSNFSILIDINPKGVKIKCKKNVTKDFTVL